MINDTTGEQFEVLVIEDTPTKMIFQIESSGEIVTAMKHGAH